MNGESILEYFETFKYDNYTCNTTHLYPGSGGNTIMQWEMKIVDTWSMKDCIVRAFSGVAFQGAFSEGCAWDTEGDLSKSFFMSCLCST